MLMLKFTRNKLASVYRKGDDILSVHGVMEDDIYGMDADLDIGLPDLEIRSISGRWNRMENAECFRALPFLKEAVGLRIDQDFTQKLQKGVGRKACRHFADLIIECCEAARDAARLILEKDPEAKRPDIEIDDYFGKAGEPGKHEPPASVSTQGKEEQTVRDASWGMVIDLHVHSAPASQCSSIMLEPLIEEAREIGLDGICLTDHNHRWDSRDVEALRQKYGFLILRGNEITTDQGDVLVLGLEEDIKGVIKLADLRDKVLKAQGFMIAAHPFRGFLTFGIGYLGLTPKKAGKRPVFQGVDAIEVMNGRVSEKENSFAAQVAEILGLPVIGGSDAHKPGEVGRYATRFADSIHNERDLIQALKKGRFSPIAFREQ
jgi:predicted metal-dependent phosphoesterase TrpH